MVDSEILKIKPEKMDKQFADLKIVCDKLGIKFWLVAGSLLGAIRENGYIMHDHDADVGMLFSDNNKFLEMFKELKEIGFKCLGGLSIMVEKERYYCWFKLVREQLIDVYCFLETNNEMIYVHGSKVINNESYYYIWKNKASDFKNLHEINLRGNKLLISDNAEELLEEWYGNWQKPTGGTCFGNKRKLEPIRVSDFMNQYFNKGKT